MPLRAVIFDVGGVLVRMADWRQHRKWEGRLELSEGELLKIVFGTGSRLLLISGSCWIEQSTYHRPAVSFAGVFCMLLSATCAISSAFNVAIGPEIRVSFIRPKHAQRVAMDRRFQTAA